MTEMAEGNSHARYACDLCNSRKVSCSREYSGCTRCQKLGASCVYSRMGIIRRAKRRKLDSSYDGNGQLSPAETPASTVSFAGSVGPFNGLQHSLPSHLEADIATTREHLISSSDVDKSIGALASLSEACATIWHDSTGIDRTERRYFPLKEHAPGWTELLVETLRKGRPLLLSKVPPDTLDHLKNDRPHKIVDRAWLVMYYSVVLSAVSSDDFDNTELKNKLRCNLWLALSDPRLMLEPSEANVQALIMLASHVQEFAGQSLTWMLASTACRMLQALGIDHRSLDGDTRQRRFMKFWHLNVLDKSLAVIFGRSPTFHRGMVREMRIPTLAEIREFQALGASAGTAGIFMAHATLQKFVVSRIMGDIWHLVYDADDLTESEVRKAIETLKTWYDDAIPVLEASMVAEKPFCDASTVSSMEDSIRMTEFHYRHLVTLLARSHPSLRQESVMASRDFLNLLQRIAHQAERPHSPITWQLLCCPFTPLLILLRDIASNEEEPRTEKEKSLEAMKQLPAYLHSMSVSSTLAQTLTPIAQDLVDHAVRAIERLNGSTPSGYAGLDDFPWNDINNSFANDFLSDTSVDWLRWDLEIPME